MPPTTRFLSTGQTQSQPLRDVLNIRSLPWTDLLDLVPDPIWIIGPQANLWFGNTAWQAITSAGAQPFTRSGTEWLLAVHEGDRRRAVTAFRSAAANRRWIDMVVRLH